MNDLERQQKLDKLKKRMLEMSATIAEQKDEIALGERVLNLVLEDHVCHSSNETVQSFIEVMTKRAKEQRKKDLEAKRERRLYKYMFDQLLWDYAHDPDCYYCPYNQYCPQRRAGLKPDDTGKCMDYIKEEVRKIAERRMVRYYDAEHESED